MKPITLLCAAALLVCAQSSEAQFLNKLRKKAEAAVGKAVTGGSSSNNSDSNASTNDNSEGGAVNGDGGGAAPVSAAASKYGQSLFTLEKSEYIVYGEISLSIKADGSHAKVVTRNNGKFYLYDNNTKSGPFDKAPVHLLDDYKRSYDNPIANQDYEQTNATSYVSAGVFEVDGKSYGKVLTVGSMYHNKKAKKFYAILVKMEQNKMAYYFVTEKTSRKINSAGSNILVSPNGELGGVVIPATQYNAKTEADAYNFVMNDDVYIVLSNGNTVGPFKYAESSSTYLDNNANYVQEASSSKNAVYVNGKPMITFTPDDHTGSGVLFLNAKATSGAWFDQGDLYFSDGTRIKNNALQPAIAVEGGKQMLYWVSLEKKNVYICKKEL
ncbi:hypothetical protein GCM10023149_01030 [Mucilaginibacter gynuensis]|uniref:WG repeat protein n=1 Tax=Mucilaginibacter gynuensis TaxID=1302236 RepID=A0ABP8FMX0_9SPHI